MSRRAEEEAAMCVAAGVPLNDMARGIGDIYFLYSEPMRAIKIGFSFDLPKRIKSLQTGSSAPLVLIGTKRGTESDERALHKKFQKRRLHGEWFKDGKVLRRFIEDAAA